VAELVEKIGVTTIVDEAEEEAEEYIAEYGAEDVMEPIEEGDTDPVEVPTVIVELDIMEVEIEVDVVSTGPAMLLSEVD
jgi:hypothetical protein